MAEENNQNFKEVEKKWQNKWALSAEVMEAKDNSDKPKKYILVEFPYPSGSGLHIGHAFTFTGGDVYARFKRMQGYNVCFPMGWDAFGLPTENYAIKTKQKPQKVTADNTAMFKKQMKELAFSFDWSRELNTTDPDYYRWTQWIFIKLFEKGLAFKQEMPINWCPSCKIGLANEEVLPAGRQESSGKCERCGMVVERRNISQWVVRITEYADKLIEGLERTNFVEKVKSSQINWIGKSQGAKVKFLISNDTVPAGRQECQIKELEVFTTRPDTLYGATFMVVAPEHQLVSDIMDSTEIKNYVVNSRKKSDLERLEINKEKTGVFSGLYAINPMTGKEIPIWISDFVLGNYGTGAIMSVPAHDERDFAFAKKFGLPIVPVIMPQRVYIDKNAKGYYAKRHEKNWQMIVELGDLARKNNKTMLLSGGWAAAIQAGKEYRENEDIDMAILESEKEWWTEQLIQMGLKVGPAYGQADADVWFQAMRDLPEGGDTHIDIDVLKTTDSFEPVAYKGQSYLVKKKEIIIAEKNEELASGKEKRWKEDADFLALGYKPYTEVGSGVMINSPEWEGLSPDEAIKKAIGYLKEKGIGQGASSYHLRDWIFSRQHYWGEPIPMINCNKCGWVTVPEDQLPVVLPEVEAYEPTDDGQSPLSKIDSFVKTTCPKCGGEARRETDTMPNWAGSDWYYLGYLFDFAKKSKNIFVENTEQIKHWLPVDVYIGGDEHNTLHLLYSRFIFKFLFDLGVIPIDEPYQKRMSHGVILGPDGQRMSKSKGNVVVPEEVSIKYGVDVTRCYLMFMGPYDGTIDWNEETLMGVKRFLDRFHNYVKQVKVISASNKNILMLANKTISGVTKDLENFKYNTAIAKMMEMLNSLTTEKEMGIKELKQMISLLAPFAPYLTEEIWSELRKDDDPNSIHETTWPVADEKYLVEDTISLSVAVNGKVRDQISIPNNQSQTSEEVIKLAKESEKVKKWIEGKKMVKEIYVPGKMVNLVIGD